MRKRFMLYISGDADGSGRFCAGSRECIALIQSTPQLLRSTRFENVDVIMQENPTLPEWLHGTPTLVDIYLKRIIRGTHARDYLLGITIDSVDEVVETKTPVYNSAGRPVAPVFYEKSVRDSDPAILTRRVHDDLLTHS